ncbi:G patch domain-containing protein 8-like [Etheostoma spectabile]|uniref:G patch domain-containing protein 8-like n=1 Tax=Etheostoma spectabile TaxID=54343 RepID=UPI0013AF09F6|nr:G patch domain-containing protein 8-like [Etheostoma spectabile]
MSPERGTGGLSGTGAQVSLFNRNVIRVEDFVNSGNGAQHSLCNDNGTGAQVGRESGTGAHHCLKSGIPGQISDSVSPVDAKDSVCRDSEAETHDDVANHTELNPTQELKDLLCPATNQQTSISGVLNDTEESSSQTRPKESNSSPSNVAEESTSLPTNRPIEPFCRVLSRDGSRVLLWPSEMVSYTKTLPSISYSINPLLYDFRAHNRAKEGGEEKKGGLEEGRERIKQSVIKQPDCQQRQEAMEGGREVKIDEREEGRQAGNPMEPVAHCSSSGGVVLGRCGCRDESALKFVPVSAECHLAPTQGLQKTGRKRRRKRRGGVRRGMRKRGRRKRGEETERGRIISNISENQISHPALDMTLPGDAISMSERVETASKRKTESPEAGETPKKKRKRGRRQTRRVVCVLRQERACGGLKTDATKLNKTGTLLDNCLGGPEGNRTEKNTDCHFLSGMKHRQCHETNNSEGTFTCYSADKLKHPHPHYYRCDDSIGGNCSADDYSQFISDASVGEQKKMCWTENPLSDCHTCSTPSCHSQCNRDGKHDAAHDKHNPSCGGCETDKDEDHSSDHLDKLNPSCNTMDTPVDFLTCSTNETHADHCQCENKTAKSEKMANNTDKIAAFCGQSSDCNDCSSCKTNGTCHHTGDFNQTNNKRGLSEEDETKPQCHIQHKNNLSESAFDYQTCRSIDPGNADGCDDTDGGQCDYRDSNHGADCNHCAHVVKNDARGKMEAVALVSVRTEQREAERDAERERKEEEERQMERKKVKEKQKEWEREWVRRKEKEREDRERRKEIDFEHLYTEKRPRFPHALPPQCIPLHAPLLLPPSLSSSFSFRHTIIQHHLSLLPPPSHLPVHSYPHLLPSFSPLSPLTLNPPPAPPPPPPLPHHPPPLHPSFYPASPIPFLDATGPYPLATAFHPMQSHHPSLYPRPHPAVMPLQVLF